MGLVGLFLIGGSVWLSITDNIAALIGLIPGGLFSVGFLPALYRTGVELDTKNKRFREYTGTLGKKKEQWIDIEDDDYISIVGIKTAYAVGLMGRSPATRRARTVLFPMSKVYFFSGDWHIEIFKGHYENAVPVANRFASTFGLEINDVYKDQNLKTSQNDLGL